MPLIKGLDRWDSQEEPNPGGKGNALRCCLLMMDAIMAVGSGLLLVI
jgi:hypothetical protein